MVTERPTWPEIQARIAGLDEQGIRNEIAQLVFNTQEELHTLRQHVDTANAGATNATSMLENSITGLIPRVQILETEARQLPEHIRTFVMSSIHESSTVATPRGSQNFMFAW